MRNFAEPKTRARARRLEPAGRALAYRGGAACAVRQADDCRSAIRGMRHGPTAAAADERRYGFAASVSGEGA